MGTDKGKKPPTRTSENGNRGPEHARQPAIEGSAQSMTPPARATLTVNSFWEALEFARVVCEHLRPAEHGTRLCLVQNKGGAMYLLFEQDPGHAPAERTLSEIEQPFRPDLGARPPTRSYDAAARRRAAALKKLRYALRLRDLVGATRRPNTPTGCIYLQFADGQEVRVGRMSTVTHRSRLTDVLAAARSVIPRYYRGREWEEVVGAFCEILGPPDHSDSYGPSSPLDLPIHNAAGFSSN